MLNSFIYCIGYRAIKLLHALTSQKALHEFFVRQVLLCTVDLPVTCQSLVLGPA